MSAHTPGPWHVIAFLDEHDRRGRNVLVSEDTPGAKYRVHAANHCVAYNVPHLEDAKAIASLPTLRTDNERLREALTEITLALETDDDHRIDVATPVGFAMLKARAALAGKGGAA